MYRMAGHVCCHGVRRVGTDGCSRHSRARPMRGCLQRFSECLDPVNLTISSRELVLCKLYSVSIATIQ